MESKQKYMLCKDIRKKLNLNILDRDNFIYEISFSSLSNYPMFINDIFNISIIRLGLQKFRKKYKIVYFNQREVGIENITYSVKKRGEIS